MGVCVFNYVFYVPSSLPLLHIAMPTPCLNTFWHSDPYIFLHFSQNVFLSCCNMVDVNFSIVSFSNVPIQLILGLQWNYTSFTPDNILMVVHKQQRKAMKQKNKMNIHVYYYYTRAITIGQRQRLF